MPQLGDNEALPREPRRSSEDRTSGIILLIPCILNKKKKSEPSVAKQMWFLAPQVYLNGHSALIRAIEITFDDKP